MKHLIIFILLFLTGCSKDNTQKKYEREILLQNVKINELEKEIDKLKRSLQAEEDLNNFRIKASINVYKSIQDEYQKLIKVLDNTKENRVSLLNDTYKEKLKLSIVKFYEGKELELDEEELRLLSIDARAEFLLYINKRQLNEF